MPPKGIHPRTCGDCQLCCTVMGVKDLDPPKPAGVRCDKLCSRGCRVYPLRPPTCRQFECLWKQGAGSAEWKPNRVGFVLDTQPDGKTIQLHPDRSRPLAWEAMADKLLSLSGAGMTVVVEREGKVATIFHEGVRHDYDA